MRIGIEAQRLFRKKKHGMEIVCLELIKSLQRLDRVNQYTVFVRDGDDPCIEETENFKIKIVKSISFADWEQIWLPKALKTEKIDILHCTSNTAPLFINIPFMLTLHDVIFLESIDFGGSAYQNFGNIYRRFVVPRAVKRAKTIITVSDFERENIIQKLKIANDKITTIYNAKSDDFRIIKDVSILKKFKASQKLPELFILHLGNTAPRKNTLGVLKAYAAYCELVPKPYPLVINSLGKEKIYKLISLNNINMGKHIDNIIALDYVEKDDLPTLYNLCSIFLYPSFREGFGLPILEAMACGTPVITSNLSSMPEVAGEAAILVDPNDPQQIADAIAGLTINIELKSQKIKKGIRQADDFSWSTTASKTLAFYQSLMKQHAINGKNFALDRNSSQHLTLDKDWRGREPF